MISGAKWHPPMSRAEQDWFAKCPKAVLFEIARQFAMRLGDDFSTEGAFRVMQEEWEILNQQNIVPQKPPRRIK